LTTRFLRFAFIVVMLSSALRAHHTFRATYDTSKSLEWRGTVTKVDWANPHVYFYVDAREERTKEIQKWVFELSAPAELEKYFGWTRDSMKIGDEVAVAGFPARSGCKCGGVRFVTLVATGKKLGPIWG